MRRVPYGKRACVGSWRVTPIRVGVSIGKGAEQERDGMRSSRKDNEEDEGEDG